MPQDAIAALRKPGTLLRRFSRPAQPGPCLTRLGRAHELAGNAETAADYLHEALRIMREIGSARGEADALVALGDLASRAGRRDEATDPLRRSAAGPGQPRFTGGGASPRAPGPARPARPALIQRPDRDPDLVRLG